ncbi:MAG: homoprotocatechuate degradation operon regulator HpaR [Gammaproteobacteria bacterium]|nr:homoprotocatechuate degradation operon regulator HpaR [Gammaproteobacteria bacterium]CAJ2376976.1 MAG: Homoprotocatechuate degradative operon repressor [Arenicellales bacterium IbO2]MDA7962174.1 homoprotocatechuate degradation operon regulator HpaR [Gammaproteobacteria bacterium]MDA7970606.1 homoprotocatechuate degradation operon regulator HpaR [Gammaproteobacteria bacterium]MDA7971815.1 homoprotocatechuate degradation operon regulator HpaR [Gammaproteobacteria bacterium]
MNRAAHAAQPGRPPLRDFAHSLPMALLRGREAVMECFRPLLAESGITEQQWRVMRALGDSGEQDMAKLARRCCILPPSMSGIIRRLEQRGHARRRPARDDQRCTLVSLTPAAHRLMDEHGRVSEQKYKEIEMIFGRANLDKLYRLLAELEVSLGALRRRRPSRRR